jgi:ABC-type enterochelin transport system permease subunit
MNKLIAMVNKYFMERSYLLIIAILLFTLLTLVLTLLPVANTLPSHIISHDKVGHFLLFGGWTFLVGYYRYISKPDNTNLLLIFLLGVIFGGCVEGLQGIMPFHRDPSLFDWAADAA